MENTNKKSNIIIALALSLLTALGGAVVFGLIYAFGYYIYFLAIGEIILAYTIFFKKYKNINWKSIIFAIVWTVFWTVVFNIFAILVCEAYSIVKIYNISFADSFNFLIKLWEINPEVKTYMNTRIIEVIGMVVLGGIVYGISYLVRYKKSAKNNQYQPAQPILTNTSISQPNTEMESNEDKLYNSLLNELKIAVANFSLDKDKDNFKSKILEIKNNKINSLTDSEKEDIKNICYKNLNDENISTSEKNAIETLLKII